MYGGFSHGLFYRANHRILRLFFEFSVKKSRWLPAGNSHWSHRDFGCFGLLFLVFPDHLAHLDALFCQQMQCFVRVTARYTHQIPTALRVGIMVDMYMVSRGGENLLGPLCIGDGTHHQGQWFQNRQQHLSSKFPQGPKQGGESDLCRISLVSYAGKASGGTVLPEKFPVFEAGRPHGPQFPPGSR